MKKPVRSKVSIRPRLWGRGKHAASFAEDPADGFQSAPGFGAGGNRAPNGSGLGMRQFQSAPGFGAGGNKHAKLNDECEFVSIRPRLWGRGKLATAIRWVYPMMFQSAPGFGAGGN